jgi:hypothetical protein
MTASMHINVPRCVRSSINEHLRDSKVGNDTLDSSGEVGDITGRNLASIDKHLEIGESAVDAAGVWVRG